MAIPAVARTILFDDRPAALEIVVDGLDVVSVVQGSTGAFEEPAGGGADDVDAGFTRVRQYIITDGEQERDA